MSDLPVPEGNQTSEELARWFLVQTTEPAEERWSALVQLALWGLDQGVQLRNLPRERRYEMEEVVGSLLSWPSEEVPMWLFQDPEAGADQKNQDQDLARRMVQATNPKEAAQLVLEAIADRRNQRNR